MDGGFNNSASDAGGYDQAELLEMLLRFLTGANQLPALGPQHDQQVATSSAFGSNIPAAYQRQPELLPSLLQELVASQLTARTQPVALPNPQQIPPAFDMSSSSLVLAALASLNAASSTSLERDRFPSATSQYSAPSASSTQAASSDSPALTQQQITSLLVGLLNPLEQQLPLQEAQLVARVQPPAAVLSQESIMAALVEVLSSLSSASPSLSLSSSQPQGSSDRSSRDDSNHNIQLAAVESSHASMSSHHRQPTSLSASVMLPRPPDAAVGATAMQQHNYGQSESRYYGNEEQEASQQLQSEEVELPPAKKRRRYVLESFPEKLYRMVEQAQEAGMQGIVSFTSNGRAFQIHRRQQLCDVILPHYFRHKRYDSFKRQLSMYGFQRIQIGPDEGAFTHPLFIRGRPELCKHMKRVTELLSGNEGDDDGGGADDDPRRVLSSSPETGEAATSTKPAGLKEPPPPPT